MSTVTRGPRQSLRANPRGESGFTLVELLVVMLILGILAAVAIPAFFSQSDKARDSAAQSYLDTAHKALEIRLTENGDKLDPVTVDELRTIEPSLKSTNNLFVLPSNAGFGSFVLAVYSDTGTYFGFLIDNQHRVTRVCQPAGGSGCKADSTW